MSIKSFTNYLAGQAESLDLFPVFLLKTPYADGSAIQELKGSYATLEAAIEAAIQIGLDLETAVIEKNGGQHSVNEWINFRVAGGGCEAVD